MRIENIEIYNYRSIKEIKLIFNDNVNVLVGPNGCGKTNILDAINTCFHAFLADKSKIEKSEFYFGTTNEKIEISLAINHNNEKYEVDWKGHPSLESSINLKEQSQFIGYYKYIPSDRIFRSAHINLRGDRGNIHRRFEKRYSDANDLLDPYLDMSLNTPDKLTTISKLISKIYPDLKEIYLSFDTKNNTAQLIAIINDFGFPITSLASGLQQLLAMISIIYYSKDSIILIDEPELHMNPQMIIGMANLIKESSFNNNNQFIIGTHSPALISTPGFNIIPLEYTKTEKGYSTIISQTISEEFVNKTHFFKGE